MLLTAPGVSHKSFHSSEAFNHLQFVSYCARCLISVVDISLYMTHLLQLLKIIGFTPQHDINITPHRKIEELK